MPRKPHVDAVPVVRVNLVLQTKVLSRLVVLFHGLHGDNQPARIVGVEPEVPVDTLERCAHEHLDEQELLPLGDVREERLEIAPDFCLVGRVFDRIDIVQEPIEQHDVVPDDQVQECFAREGRIDELQRSHGQKELLGLDARPRCWPSRSSSAHSSRRRT